MGTLALVLDAARFGTELSEAAIWSDHITLCLVAPNSERGSVAAWGQLLDARAKYERVIINGAPTTEGWLLRELQDTGALRLLDSASQRFSSNLLVFRRGVDVRAFVAPVGLTRAAVQADCGAVVAFEGAADSPFAQSCQQLVDQWRELSRVPTGSELDQLTASTPDTVPQVSVAPSDVGALTLISEPMALQEAFRSLIRHLRPTAAVDPARTNAPDAQNVSLAGGWSLSSTSTEGGIDLVLDDSGADSVPISLVLRGAEALASSDAWLLRDGSGLVFLVWRGGLLGRSQKKNAMLWSQCRLATFAIHDEAWGEPEQVGLVASTEREPATEIVAFGEEVRRLEELFGATRRSPLAPASAEFIRLSEQEQQGLLWAALIGLGAIPVDEAVTITAQALRAQGYVQYQRLRRDGGLYRALADRLRQEARAGNGFDAPARGEVRAVQPDLEDYSREDWLECLVSALPEREVVDRTTAIRLIFDYARSYWGLGSQRLRSGGKTESALKSTLNSAIRRGLLRRVGAAYVEKVTSGVSPAAGDQEPRDATAGVEAPIDPATATASGTSADDEPLVQTPPAAAMAEPSISQPDEPLAQALAMFELPVRTQNWAERAQFATLGDLVAWHPDAFAAEPNVGRLTVAETRAVVEAALGCEWEEAWAALPEPKIHPADSSEDTGGTSEGLPSPEQSLWNRRLASLSEQHHGLPLSRLALPSRMRTYCEQAGLASVAELLRIPRDELLAQPNIGRASLTQTLEALEAALEELNQPGADESFLVGWRRVLQRLPSMQRLVVSRRSGLHGPRETLETVGETLGVTRERVRQIEAQCLEDVRLRSPWVEALRRRLNEAFAGGRCVPVDLLVEADPWWRGSNECPELVEYVLDRLLEGQLHRIEVERQGKKEAFLAQFTREHLRQVELELLDAAAAVETPAAIAEYERAVDAAAAKLDPSMRDYLRALLEDHLHFDEREPGRVVGFGNTRPAQVLALLASQPEPMAVSAVFQALGRCQLPDEVLYFRRGIVGLEQHFPEFQGWSQRLVPECLRLMAELPAGRQWMVPELHQTLKDAGLLPDWLGHWHLASLLRRSGQVAYLGRLRVALPSDGNRQERIHHQDAVLSVLEEAGEPLPIGNIAERVRLRTDVRDDTLSILLLSSPFVKLEADRYGLVERDVLGGADAIAQAVQAVVQVLETSERGLTAHQAYRLVVARVGRPWSSDLVTSLLRSEPQLRLARSGNVGLSSWDDVRAPTRGEFIRQQVDKAGGRLTVDALNELLREIYGRSLDRAELHAECHRNELRLDGELVLAHEAATASRPVAAADETDLSGRVNGIPAAALQHFEELLSERLRPASELLERARAHLADIEAAARHNEFLEVPLAKRLVELHERLLAHVSSLSPATQRIAQAAVLYFISTEDAEDDFELGGLEDDHAVLRAVLTHLELDWS